LTISYYLRSLPTPAKLLLMLSLALLPIGAALVASSLGGLREARRVIQDSSAQEADAAAETLNSLIARNALALRVAANAALRNGSATACAEAQRILAIAPAVAQSFELEDSGGTPICAVGNWDDLDRPPLTAPGAIREWVATDAKSLLVRVGVVGGSATTRLTLKEIRDAIGPTGPSVERIQIDDKRVVMDVAELPPREGKGLLVSRSVPVGDGELLVNFNTRQRAIGTLERMMILLPVLMWALAALISWWLVHRLLISPLRRLQRAVGEYQPGPGNVIALPPGLGPATEIRELGEAFIRAVDRIEHGERQMAQALEGQTRLVREVHHRVKNNLQVVASLLSIHGRTAEDVEAKAAYAAIGRRVDALSVVHRNHYAELEENQGIALRPMLTELAAGLRASSPEGVLPIKIELELDNISTTQDVAVATAFLITEVVEYSMLHSAAQPVEIMLRRNSELTARLSLTSAGLLEKNMESDERRQFERIVDALARQLRAPLDRKIGTYALDLPAFPPMERRRAQRSDQS
jgi:two-component sensor histidine kinase